MFNIIKKKKCPPPYRGVRPEKLLSDQMVVTTKEVYYPALSGNKKYKIWSRAGQMTVKFAGLFVALIVCLFFIVKGHKTHKHHPKSTETTGQAKTSKPIAAKKQVLAASLATLPSSTTTTIANSNKKSSNSEFIPSPKTKKSSPKKKIKKTKKHKSQKKIRSSPLKIRKREKRKVKKSKVLNDLYIYASNKWKGLKNKKGQVIVPAQFTAIGQFDNGKARVRRESRQQVYTFFINPQGQCVDNCKEKAGLFLIRRVADQYGFFTLNNTPLSNDLFNAVRFELGDSIPTRKGKRWGFFSISKKKWLPK